MIESDPMDLAVQEAHDAGDHERLVALYRAAGDRASSVTDIDAACFFWTHAYVLALELGSDEVDELHALLSRHGRV